MGNDFHVLSICMHFSVTITSFTSQMSLLVVIVIMVSKYEQVQNVHNFMSSFNAKKYFSVLISSK